MTRRFKTLADKGLDDDGIAWSLNDSLVNAAQEVFLPVWEQTRGNDGYVSFEVDPLLEDVSNLPPRDKAVKRIYRTGEEMGRRA